MYTISPGHDMTFPTYLTKNELRDLLIVTKSQLLRKKLQNVLDKAEQEFPSASTSIKDVIEKNTVSSNFDWNDITVELT